MAKVLLVNTLKEFRGVNVIALCALSAVLKKHGHMVELLDYACPGSLTEQTHQALKVFAPDMVGINVMTSHQLKATKEVSSLIKQEAGVPIVAGGMAVSLDPQACLSFPGIDAVCIGEGEGPLLDMVSASDSRQWAGIDNLWVKTGGKNDTAVFKQNPVRPLIEDLNTLPLTDLSLFRKSLLKCRPQYIALMANRGCPYDCTYCANAVYRGLFPNGQHYTRYRDPGLVIQEMFMAKESYPEQLIYFEDDTFALNDAWLDAFSAALLKSGFSHPFSINIRLEKVNCALIKELVKAGLKNVRFGVETGDQQYRARVLNRNASNGEYLKNAARLHELGISLWGYNMCGLPFETEDMLKKTIRLNARLKLSAISFQTFKPYKGTALRALVEREGLLRLDPADCSCADSSYRDLFIATRCHTKTYVDYFRTLKALNYCLDRFNDLKGHPAVVYGLAIALKTAISVLPYRLVTFGWSCLKAMNRFFRPPVSAGVK